MNEQIFDCEGPNISGDYGREPSLRDMVQHYYGSFDALTGPAVGQLTKTYIERWVVENVEKCTNQVEKSTRKNLKLELRVRGLELTVKVLEQDEADTRKDGEGSFVFEASDGFTIYSDQHVGVYEPYRDLFIKGVDSIDSYSHEFYSEPNLNNYITRLKQAVKEFNAAGGFAKKVEETVEIVE